VVGLEGGDVVPHTEALIAALADAARSFRALD
jgi:hypothetical protein